MVAEAVWGVGLVVTSAECVLGSGGEGAFVISVIVAHVLLCMHDPRVCASPSTWVLKFRVETLNPHNDKRDAS